MTKPLPLRDFRARRRVLESKDYGLPGPMPRATDLVTRKTWESIWNLPDTVAIETSNVFGSALAEVEALSSAWTRLYEPLGLLDSAPASPLAITALESADAFDSSILCATVGYYRLAFMALPSAVENMSIALQFELSADRRGFRRWKDGRDENVKFGWAAGKLPAHAGMRRLEAALQARTGNDLFRQKNGRRLPGHARQFFGWLSKFAHAWPGHTDSELWDGSNGPNFTRKTFTKWLDAYVASWAFALLLLRLGRPDVVSLDPPGHAGDALSRTPRDLFDNAVRLLAPGARLRHALRSVPAATWK
jgi:hypothetical protein